MYVQVVLGLPVEGPFDYSVPDEFYKKIRVGIRVRVSFRTRKMVGYVIKLTQKTNIKNTKPILEVLDSSPVLNKEMLLLTKELSNYYCCSWGEAIEAAIPPALRKDRIMPTLAGQNRKVGNTNPEIILWHDMDSGERWERFIPEIKNTLNNHKSVIMLLPDISSVMQAKKRIESSIDCSLSILYRKQPNELEEWARIREGKVNIVIGTRSAIFAPLNNLGLIIIDEEQDSVYKQEQTPHYHAREVAFMRVDIEKIRLLMASASPSLESLYLSRKNKIKYLPLAKKRSFPEIKILDTGNLLSSARKRKPILTRYLEDCIIFELNAKGKVLLFLNRKGFATFASCRYCGGVLICPRCNINLVYHFSENVLRCHYCNFKTPPPKICPSCNSGYIRYFGLGAEKIESELSRLFPQARIKRWDGRKIEVSDADIFIATESFLKTGDYNFDLVAVLAVDNSLNRVDFRSSEKTFALLVKLLELTEKKFIIQTNLPGHYCFRALENKDINIFYEQELKQRKQLGLPPYKHIGLVKLRGAKEERLKQTSQKLFTLLKKNNKSKNIKIISVNPFSPSKLRGNFYWQILVSAVNPLGITKFLKTHLKKFSHSGIIVTVDIDPI